MHLNNPQDPNYRCTVCNKPHGRFFESTLCCLKQGDSAPRQDVKEARSYYGRLVPSGWDKIAEKERSLLRDS